MIDVEGCWIGVATHGSQVFRYHWCLKQVGFEVSGEISLSMPDGSLPGSYRMRGNVRDSRLWFEGIEFIIDPGRWCLAAGLLQYSSFPDGLAELRGTWGPLNVRGGCPPGCFGDVILRRS